MLDGRRISPVERNLVRAYRAFCHFLSWFKLRKSPSDRLQA
jgi:hypothetical protein